VPWEAFETEEKALLIPIQAERFDPPTWCRCKVHPDHHIRFGKALYSLPTRWIGCQVDVRGDRSLVRIYVRSELIKTHEAGRPAAARPITPITRMSGLPTLCPSPIQALSYRRPGVPFCTQGGYPTRVHGYTRPSKALSLRAGVSQAGFDALDNQTALQFSNGAEDRECHFADWC
jgi:hypothetical protein